jgi:predicted patatin/cPLA2 family phospholipase
MKVALVLQGGGARGIFTSGVLDALLDTNINIDRIYAVSAGGLNAMNYISKQKGRSKIATSMTFKSKEFKSMKNIIRKHTFVDFNYYFNGLEETLPFDQKTYDESKTEFVVVGTSLKTGKAKYFNKKEYSDFNQCITCSASIPLVAKMVNIDDDYFLDGGDSDPIPFEKAFKDGFDKVILVTTRPISFRKEIARDRFIERLHKLAYKDYPEYLKSLKYSHQNYNNEFDKLKKYSSDQLFIISPTENIDLKHLETNDEKLDYYYNLGFKTFNDNKEKLSDFLR